ncbi:MAG: hypothetical protein WAU91_04425 [Desulfatitalea sp.]
MKLFKRLAINVHSRVEAMANQFENKEALSFTYIREYEGVVAKAKVRLSQVQADVSRLENEATRLRDQAALWVERAKQVHATDQAKALACVARMKKTQALHGQIVRDLHESQNLKQKMAQEVEQILAKLEALRRKQRDLSGRQACAEAVNGLHHAESGMQQEVDDLFTRWETDVIAQELHAQAPQSEIDTLEEEFGTAEHEQALRLTLQEIIAVPSPGEEKIR